MIDLAKPPQDRVAIGTSRIVGKFANATQFAAFVAAVMAPFNEIEAVYQSTDPTVITMAMLLDVFTSVVRTGSLLPRVAGVHLDRIGEIVGLRRGIASKGQTVILNDSDYRTCLAAKIARNNYSGLWEGDNGLLACLALVFSLGGSVSVQAFQPAAMALILTIGRDLSTTETVIIRNFGSFLPLNQSVSIDTFITYVSAYFGWQEDTNADGYAENLPGGSISTNGGSLAENVI
jgi:hypothetical protein